YRECLRDFFDMPALVQTLADLRSRKLRLATVDSEKPSPFAASLLFSYVASFLYDGDAPLAERRAQALAVDQAQLRELPGDPELRYARTHAPFTADEFGARYGLTPAMAESILVRLTGENRLLEGEFRPGGTRREWTDQNVLRMIRRRSLATLRKEVEPVEQ